MSIIKLTVETGYVNGDHIDYCDTPDNWDNYTENEKERYMNDAANEYLHEVCQAYGEVVEEED